MSYLDNCRPEKVAEALRQIRALRKVALTKEMLFYAERRITQRLTLAEVTAVATALDDAVDPSQAGQ